MRRTRFAIFLAASRAGPHRGGRIGARRRAAVDARCARAHRDAGPPHRAPAAARPAPRRCATATPRCHTPASTSGRSSCWPGFWDCSAPALRVRSRPAGLVSPGAGAPRPPVSLEPGEHRTGSPAETEALAAQLAAALVPGDVVLVEGELGAGKTTFVRGACRALGVTGPVTSPTFTIGQRYPAPVPVVPPRPLPDRRPRRRGSGAARRLPPRRTRSRSSSGRRGPRPSWRRSGTSRGGSQLEHAGGRSAGGEDPAEAPRARHRHPRHVGGRLRRRADVRGARRPAARRAAGSRPAGAARSPPRCSTRAGWAFSSVEQIVVGRGPGIVHRPADRDRHRARARDLASACR